MPISCCCLAYQKTDPSALWSGWRHELPNRVEDNFKLRGVFPFQSSAPALRLMQSSGASEQKRA
jgi:hypothetical protein